MKKYNISTNLIQIIKNLYNKATSAVLFNSCIGDWFRTAVALRQGCLLSPTLFNIFLERIMKDVLEDHEGTVSIRGRTITNLPLWWWHWWLSRRGRTGKFCWASWHSLHSQRHGDQCREDQAGDKQRQWHQHRDQSEWTEAWDSHKLQIPGLSYNLRGFQTWDTLQDSKDNSSIAVLKPVWIDKSISLSSMIRLMHSLVTSIFLYASESRTLTAELQRRIPAMEMRCCRKILHISYKDHVTNEEVRAKIQQAIGPQDNLLTIVKRRKLQWYGHVSRSSGLAKTILKGTVKGGTRQGWQRKRWGDNIREWTGLEFGKSQRAVENREKWRKLVAKSSVVPNRPSRLRDWWWWWDNIRGINSKVSVSLWLVLYKFDGTKANKTKCMLMANRRKKKIIKEEEGERKKSCPLI